MMDQGRSHEPRWYDGASPWLVALVLFSIAFGVVAVGLLMLSPRGWG
jgi:hypothetical protein